MIIYQIQPSGREVVAEVLKRTKQGDAFVQPIDGELRRWVPKNWIIEDDREDRSQ
jgi:DNA-binding PadR family transcriptional regulator